MPNGSCCCSDWKIAWLAGQKKKTIVISSCGATSAYGNQEERKTTRFSMGKRYAGWRTARRVKLPGRPCAVNSAPPRLLLRRLLEPAQHVVAACDRGVESRLRVFLAGEHVLHLLLEHVADLHEAAEAQALRVPRRRLAGHLADRDVGSRVLLVETRALRQVIGDRRDRQV